MGRGRVVIAEEIGRPGIDEPVVGIGSWGGGVVVLVRLLFGHV